MASAPVFPVTQLGIPVDISTAVATPATAGTTIITAGASGGEYWGTAVHLSVGTWPGGDIYFQHNSKYIGKISNPQSIALAETTDTLIGVFQPIGGFIRLANGDTIKAAPNKTGGTYTTYSLAPGGNY